MSSPKHELAARIGGFAAFGIPLAIGILAASPEPYWLDSPEFTAAAQTLGIAHPPGHPLYAMLAKPFTLIPLGGIALRVALASAVFGALASFVFYRLAYLLIDATSIRPRGWISAAGACTAALLLAVTPGWWFQSVRAEVYSLQILLVLGALYPLVVYCLQQPEERSERLLMAAAFLVGLGLTNHHFIMFVCLPAAIPMLVSTAKQRGSGAVRLTCRLAATGAVGLLPYLFIPIRSAAGAAVALGGVHSLSDFLWVVSARVYQKSMVRQHVSALSDRSLDAIYTMMGELHPVLLILSLAGLYLLLRRRDTRLVGTTLTLLAGITIFLRAVMGFDPFNPDYYGYMLPALVGFVAGLAVLFGVILSFLRERPRHGAILAPALAVALVALPIARARAARPKVDLSDFRATRLLLDLSLGRAEAGTLVLTSYYKLFFVLWSARFIDGFRPDIVVVNPQLFGYPGYLNSTLVRHPELKTLARAMIIHGRVTEAAVADLAWNGPLRIEPDPWIDEQVTRYMIPDGPTYATSPEPLSEADVQAASPAHFTRWRRFYHLLGPHWQEHETWRLLSWYHYMDALFMARRGDRAGARVALEMARALGSVAHEFERLGAAIDDGRKGPVDISEFLAEAALPPKASADTTPPGS